MKKKCNICKQNKDITEFYSNMKRNKLCYSSKCKNCFKQVYQTNKESKIQYGINYYQDNLEKCKKQSLDNYYKHQEALQTYGRERYYKHREELKNYGRERYYKHREKLIVYSKKYITNRLKNDPLFKLKNTIASNLHIRLKRGNYVSVYKGKDKVVEYIGISILDLKQHIEKQFKLGMTWENYGKVWHIDHRLPSSFFDYNDLTEIKLCWHWGNLQPMFTKDNLSKHATIPEKLLFVY